MEQTAPIASSTDTRGAASFVEWGAVAGGRGSRSRLRISNWALSHVSLAKLGSSSESHRDAGRFSGWQGAMAACGSS